MQETLSLVTQCMEMEDITLSIIRHPEINTARFPHGNTIKE